MNSNHELKIKRKINHNGMTLIEVVVALAIIGIIAIGIIPMFSSGIKLLVNNGIQIKSMYTKQDKTEKNISIGTDSIDGELELIFSGEPIKVKGKKIIVEDSYNLFIPNPIQP